MIMDYFLGINMPAKKQLEPLSTNDTHFPKRKATVSTSMKHISKMAGNILEDVRSQQQAILPVLQLLDNIRAQCRPANGKWVQ